jgi:hypothetical protein
MQPNQNVPINSSMPVGSDQNIIPQAQAQLQHNVVQPFQEANTYFKNLKARLLKIMFLSLCLTVMVYLVTISLTSYYYEEEAPTSVISTGQNK